MILYITKEEFFCLMKNIYENQEVTHIITIHNNNIKKVIEIIEVKE